MTRYRAKKTAVGVSLFPFLAVLICTMGALIVLLVMVVQMARVDASEAPAERPNELDPKVIERESYEWRQKLLKEQRSKLKEDVESHRSELSHLEQHIRELERRWTQLRAEGADLQQRLNGDQDDDQRSLTHLGQLRSAIDMAKQELDKAKTELASRPRQFAILPYDGPNGTRRRPIYLECTEQGVTIQPEGILLREAAFQGPLGAGNPLDAALRAMRQYYARLEAGQAPSDPYPLLIVRPGGADAYALARAAMRAWDDEFGYELLDATKALKYPAADPALKRLLEKVVADARSRQAILAAAMPSRFGRRNGSGFVASPTRGGFVPEGGASRARRAGGFGTGGDARFVDGRSRRAKLDEAPPETSQAVGGPAGEGNVGGKPGAARGSGVDPLAKKRGRNWGLPHSTDGATGIIRPIRLACLPDRLILLPDKGEQRAPQVILVRDAMADEVDTLVSKVWDEIDRWGIAVTGGYWKPVLHINVAQGAESRFEELRVLLIGSGLEVQRVSRETTRTPIR